MTLPCLTDGLRVIYLMGTRRRAKVKVQPVFSLFYQAPTLVVRLAWLYRRHRLPRWSDLRLDCAYVLVARSRFIWVRPHAVSVEHQCPDSNVTMARVVRLPDANSRCLFRNLSASFDSSGQTAVFVRVGRGRYGERSHSG